MYKKVNFNCMFCIGICKLQEIYANYIELFGLIVVTAELIGTGECSSPEPGDSCHDLWLTYFYSALNT